MKKPFLIGLLLGITLVSCVSFTYDRYGLSLKNQRLLHYSKSDKDLPLNVCDETDGYKCVVMFKDEFYQMKAEYEAIAAALKICEKK